MDCIFCKIASGEIPAKIHFESETLLVVEDVDPQAPVHQLVIPKKHYRSILDVDDTALFGEMLSVARDAAKKSGVDETGFRIVVNTNDEGGQTVFHIHMHVIGGRPLAGKMG